ncbi:hypothetical protein [Alkalihalobacterium bogoriense]|uniref:hypothetical protein n=1 Tax=Alkalihalobacterium bogoriense TaxID=246272 RepID=UPI00047D16BA|nr:hypothetical protein [Alkalihalobacterium bogoriense]
MSAKEEILLKEISEFLHGYLKAGKVTINSFFSKVNVNIQNLEQLLTIRFLLKEETMDFVRDLPILLKRFKTTTTMKRETHSGEIRGQIDWEHTIKDRLARNYKDKTIYATNESTRTYNIPENLVLKELLGLLYSILYKDSYVQGFEKAKWFVEWQKLKGNIAQAYKKNIYLQRVEHVAVSDRIIRKTLQHRNQLYRDAAKLLLVYRKLMNRQFHEEDIIELLRETFIEPGNQDVLFELYWVVQVIKQNSNDCRLHLLDGSQNKVASWEDESQVFHIYHDSTGSNSIAFKIEANEIADSQNPYLQQKFNAFSISNQYAKAIFGRNPTNIVWRGRPDFLLEVFDKKKNELVTLTIGEVKNTSKVDYAITGMEELLDYIYLVKNRKWDYLFGSDVKVNGLLCVGDVPIPGNTNMELVQVVKRRF